MTKKRSNSSCRPASTGRSGTAAAARGTGSRRGPRRDAPGVGAGRLGGLAGGEGVFEYVEIDYDPVGKGGGEGAHGRPVHRRRRRRCGGRWRRRKRIPIN